MSAPTLGARAVAAGVRWERGMTDMDGYTATGEDLLVWVNVDDPSDPDPHDPATQGCILAQASERWVANWATFTQSRSAAVGAGSWSALPFGATVAR